MSERYFYDDFACHLVNLSKNTNSSKLSKNATMIQNCEYANKLDEVQQQEGKLKDVDQLHMKGWMQITNIFAGCVILGILIYRHNTT